jgi:hypothetical protein
VEDKSTGGVEAAAKLLVQVGNLGLELGVALCRTLGNDVIDEAITVFQFVTGLITAKTKGRGILPMGNGYDHKVNKRGHKLRK